MFLLYGQLHASTQTFQQVMNATQCQFLCRLEMVWIQNFPSCIIFTDLLSRTHPAVLPDLISRTHPAVLQLLDNRWIHTFHKGENSKNSSKIEISWLIIFSTITSDTLNLPPWKDYYWFGLIWFYGISIIACYLMPKSFYIHKQFYLTHFTLV